MILIAEIGNVHLGSVESMKEHIRVAKECGADLVKSQAFEAKDVSAKGSMPKAFYERCALSVTEYLECISYAESIGIPFFYTIFSRSLDPLLHHQEYRKVAGNQTLNDYKYAESLDSEKTFVSIPSASRFPTGLRKSTVLHVSGYLVQDPVLANIGFLRDFYGDRVGYSDHTIGIEHSLRAIHQYGATVVEKHFQINRDCYWEGVQYRDVVHGASPSQLAELAKKAKG